MQCFVRGTTGDAGAMQQLIPTQTTEQLSCTVAGVWSLPTPVAHLKTVKKSERQLPSAPNCSLGRAAALAVLALLRTKISNYMSLPAIQHTKSMRPTAHGHAAGRVVYTGLSYTCGLGRPLSPHAP